MNVSIFMSHCHPETHLWHDTLLGRCNGNQAMDLVTMHTKVSAIPTSNYSSKALLL
jgi:hypothetical protein